MPTIPLDDRLIEYSIRESKRAKYLSIRVHRQTGAIEVVVPSRAKHHHDVEAFLHDRTDWIRKQLHRVEQTPPPPTRNYRTGEQILIYGEQNTLFTQYLANQSFSVVHQPPTLIVHSPLFTSHAERIDATREVIIEWMREIAKETIPPRVAEIAEEHQFTYNRVTIKNLKSRWGSCSVKHNLNFNLRLVMMPPWVSDYIIIHELCHLCEMNHSKRFWKLVEQYCPNYRNAIQWLKDHQTQLQL